MTTIAIVSRSLWPFIKGGAEKFIYTLGQRLKSYGFNVLFITLSPGSIDKKSFSQENIIFIKNPFIKPIPLVSSLYFSVIASIIVNILKPDAVIVNGYWGEASPSLISRHIPVVVVIHDVGLFTSEYARRNRIKYLLRKAVLTLTTRRAWAIVVPTSTVKKDLVKYLGVDPSKILVLGGEGVEGPFKREHIENKYFDVVHVGRFAPNKGQLVSLKAFREVVERIPNARLWLVGGLSSNIEHLKYYREVLVEAKKINESIGREAVVIVVNAPSIEEYYRIADVCIAPSLAEEGYGLTIVECMAYGKPVIASDVFLETSVAARDRNIVVKRGSYEELARAIIRLYNDRKLYDSLSEKGLSYVRMLSWDNVALFFKKLLNKLLD